jgi:hypothetical protein
MYYSLDELNQNIISLAYSVQQPLQEDPRIMNRSVRFKDQNDTVLFFKDSSPSEINETLPNHKIQVACDTNTTTNSCYQSTQQFMLYR